jgi:hypothetical protein
VTVTVVLAHAASTWFLAGLVWLVQVVHYPLFSQVGRDGFVAYEAAHSARITRVLALPWAVQGATTLMLLLAPPAGPSRSLVWTCAVLAAIPVAVTVALSIPAHRQLGQGFDEGAHRRLVATNWLRTAAWTVHALLVLPLVAASLGVDT